MLAVVTKTADGYVARFERKLKFPVEKVWEMLTANEKLSGWFAELRVEDLREGGLITFDMGDGTFEEMKITAFKHLSVLEYTWGNDLVRFELYPEPEGGCTLILQEFIRELNDHSPRDLAGWDVCLNAIAALLAGETFDERKEAWEPKYEAYRNWLVQAGYLQG